MDSQPVSPADLADALCIPVGTLEFTYTSETLFDADASGTILDQIAGQSHFRIERLPNLKLSFFHTSPGVGTRVAQIDLSQVEVAGTVEIGISWEPQNIALFLRPRIDGARGVVAHGSPSEVQFLVSPDGFVIAVGGPGVEVIGARMTTGGRQVIEPTAIEAWNETLKAIEVLWNASSADGFIYESVRTNLTISLLVTGFEAYTKRRFTEIQGEGIIADVDSLLNSFYAARVKLHGLDTVKAELEADAEASKRTLLRQIAHETNFQNFDRCKTAFGKAYGLKFGEISEAQPVIDPLRKFIRHRHRIVHVSPLLGTLATPGDAEGTNEPVFSNEATGKAAKDTFGRFIAALHAATLKLRPFS